MGGKHPFTKIGWRDWGRRMFTGLVACTGQVVGVAGSNPRRLSVASSLKVEDMAVGDSIAHDGCCLTVVGCTQAAVPEAASETTPKMLDPGASGSIIEVEAVTETLQRTTLGSLEVGDEVHLEPALAVGQRMGGHWVTGHVDAVGEVLDVTQKGGALHAWVQVPHALAHFIASQGSVTVAGVSLTVVAVQDAVFEVGLIPHTLAATHFGDWSPKGGIRVGQALNIEVDILARHVERMLQMKPDWLQSLVNKGVA